MVVLISKDLIDSNLIHDVFFFVKTKHENIKEWNCIKQQEARRLLNKINKKAPILSDLPIAKLLF